MTGERAAGDSAAGDWGAGDWGAGDERRVPGGPQDDAPAGADPIAVVAVVVGFLGIVVFGILLALIAAILGSIAGGRAREAGRSLELPYLAFLLAGVDGFVWIALHYLFDIPYPVG